MAAADFEGPLDVGVLISLADRLEGAVVTGDIGTFQEMLLLFAGTVRLSTTRNAIEILGLPCSNGLFAFIPITQALAEGLGAAPDHHAPAVPTSRTVEPSR